MSTAPEPRPHATSLLTGELDDAAFEALLERSLDDPELDAEIRLVADVVAAAERRSETPRAAEPGRRDRRLLLFATGVVGLAAAVLFIVLGPGALREESADSEQPTSVAQAPMATDSGAEVADAADGDSGTYTLRTVKPGSVIGHDGHPMAPHISIWIVARGINIGLHTRIYFDDEDNSADPLLARIEQRQRIDTMIATSTPGIP